MRPWLAWTLWASVLAARPWHERTALLQTQPVSFTDSSGGTWRFTVHATGHVGSGRHGVLGAAAAGQVEL